MLSNAYFLANFRFDTAENEPAKNLQNVARVANFAKTVASLSDRRRLAVHDRVVAVEALPHELPERREGRELAA